MGRYKDINLFGFITAIAI